MSYFSRLSDIVTCNLSAILAQEADPRAALREIIREMEEGLAGARRSMTTARSSAERIEQDLREQRGLAERWTARARQALQDGDEQQARAALERKQETGDLIAGIEQQFEAAVATSNHLTTMHRALEARLLDARRKLDELESGEAPSPATPVALSPTAPQDATLQKSRDQKVDEELESLRRELGPPGK